MKKKLFLSLALGALVALVACSQADKHPPNLGDCDGCDTPIVGVGGDSGATDGAPDGATDASAGDASDASLDAAGDATATSDASQDAPDDASILDTGVTE